MKSYKFIENKNINYSLVINYLKLSKKQNHFANYGPVQKKLEKKLSSLLRLNHKGLKLILCNSATSGLHTLGHYFNLISKKKNRWLIANNSFYSINTGVFHDSIIIDCNKNGVISLQDIKRVPINKYDGVIYTNTYANNSFCEDIKKYCNNKKKFFLADNAVGLLDSCIKKKSNFDGLSNFEVISFHHTKPWGFGEGGAIICPNKYETVIRSLISYGSIDFTKYKKYASNFKISDISCSFILQRIGNINFWKRRYFEQEKRIENLIKKKFQKISLLKGNSLLKSPRSYIPLIFPNKVSIKKLKKISNVALEKYYAPLVNNNKFKNSKYIYDHIVCFPNNPELLILGNIHIEKIFKKLLK